MTGPPASAIGVAPPRTRSRLASTPTLVLSDAAIAVSCRSWCAPVMVWQSSLGSSGTGSAAMAGRALACLLLGVAAAAPLSGLGVVPRLRLERRGVSPAPVWDGRVLNRLGARLAVCHR